MEIERTLTRYGATAFGYMTEVGRAVIMFESKGRRMKFVLPLPSPDEKRFTHHSRGTRTKTQALAAWEQACRERWRALNLAIKAKLEAVECGIATFEDEFLAYICLPSGQTVGEALAPGIELAYQTGKMPALMPGA